MESNYNQKLEHFCTEDREGPLSNVLTMWIRWFGKKHDVQSTCTAAQGFAQEL